MSLIKAIRQQLGLSVTPGNNFCLDASADNGTMKLARGNSGATTQDVMTVDAAGKVAFPQMPQSLISSGYINLPGGLIIQWGVGQAAFSTSGAATATTVITFPTTFPNNALVAMTNPNTNSPDKFMTTTGVITVTGFTAYMRATSAHTGNVPFFWIAIGR